LEAETNFIERVSNPFHRGQDLAARLAHLTDLRRVFTPWAFTSGAYSSERANRLTVAVRSFDGSLLRLHLENEASAFAGDVWIDVERRQVSGALEEGREAIPR
jgi:hypothetical protein